MTYLSQTLLLSDVISDYTSNDQSLTFQMVASFYPRLVNLDSGSFDSKPTIKAVEILNVHLVTTLTPLDHGVTMLTSVPPWNPVRIRVRT